MVLIEVVRGTMRPLTLSVRLAANITAGHLIMVLVRTPLALSSWGMSIAILIGLVLVAVLELAVAIIQAYVFMALSSLYISEVNNPSL